jgi:hypothetical protein
MANIHSRINMGTWSSSNDGENQRVNLWATHRCFHTGPVLRFLGPRARLKLRALNIYIKIILINISTKIYVFSNT